MTFKEQLSIYFGNTEDAWSSSDESEEKEVGKIETPETEKAREWKNKHGGEMPREHHSW